ncbi:MAG: aminotransferase class IV [Pyrinomonadaceae bacterium]
MHDLVVFLDQIIPASDAKASSISNQFLYGKGIFSTVAIYDSEPFLFEKHWARLSANAAKTGIDLAEFSDSRVKRSLIELIGKNHVVNGKARITFFDGSVNRIWNNEEVNPDTGILIQTAKPNPKVHNISLSVSPFPVNSRSPLAGVKSCNYLENLLAIENAKASGFDEAVRLNERGSVTSACMANVFWAKDKELFTPDLKTGCLPGTTRELILERYDVKEIEAGVESLLKADQIFLTSAGIGIVQVGKLENRQLDPALHPLTELINKELSAIR